MNPHLKSVIFLSIGLIIVLLFAGCTKASYGTMIGASPMFIAYNNKVYENTMDLEKSVIDGKLSSSEQYKNYYKIKDTDTNKAFAFENKDSDLFKYEYLCPEIFSWKSKSYKISYQGFAVQNGYSQGSDGCKLGKSLVKVENLEIFENTAKDSTGTLLVRPDGLNAPTKESYFLAVAQ